MAELQIGDGDVGELWRWRWWWKRIGPRRHGFGARIREAFVGLIRVKGYSRHRGHLNLNIERYLTVRPYLGNLGRCAEPANCRKEILQRPRSGWGKAPSCVLYMWVTRERGNIDPLPTRPKAAGCFSFLGSIFVETC